MMFLLEINYVGVKLVPRSDIRDGTAPRRINSKQFSFNIGTWNVRTLRRAGRLENLTSEMYKCELNMVGLSEATVV